MDVRHIVNQLRAERNLLDEVIASLERLVTAPVKRRGRPPRWMAAARSRGLELRTGVSEIHSSGVESAIVEIVQPKKNRRGRRREWSAAAGTNPIARVADAG